MGERAAVKKKSQQLRGAMAEAPAAAATPARTSFVAIAAPDAAPTTDAALVAAFTALAPAGSIELRDFWFAHPFLSAAQAVWAFEEFDVDGDGSLSFTEYVRFATIAGDDMSACADWPPQVDGSAASAEAALAALDATGAAPYEPPEGSARPRWCASWGTARPLPAGAATPAGFVRRPTLRDVVPDASGKGGADGGSAAPRSAMPPPQRAPSRHPRRKADRWKGAGRSKARAARRRRRRRPGSS